MTDPIAAKSRQFPVSTWWETNQSLTYVRTRPQHAWPDEACAAFYPPHDNTLWYQSGILEIPATRTAAPRGSAWVPAGLRVLQLTFIGAQFVAGQCEVRLGAVQH